MAKYKKVKRYHRSFYSPGMWVKKAVGIIVLVVVVLVVGWLAAPHVLDWATHTWYTVVRNRDLSASSETTASSAAASSEVTAEPAASSEVRTDSEPESEPAAPAGVIIEGSWGVLDTAAAKDEASLRAAARFGQISGSAIREIFKMIAKPGMISFAGGNPAASALPDAECAEIARDVLQNDGKRILQYGATEGYPPLLESLHAYVEQQLGCAVPAVLPVTGSTQAMDLLCKALIDPGDVILVENPSFLGNMQCMRLYQATLVPVESDENGIIPEKLEEAMRQYHPKLLYTIPTFQNPTGITLAADRRKPIAELAAKYHVVVAEDDPYRDLRYAGEACPSIKSFDKDGWVVFLGSFSKIISPGLRVGFMAGDASILRKCTVGKQSTDVHTANLTQAIVDQYLRRGLLPDHITSICRSYKAQLDAMLSELSTFPEGTTYTRPDGGLFIFVTLPEGIDAKELLEQAVERHVAYVPGTHFFCDGGHENTLRLNFSNASIAQIHEGMSTLREIFAQALAK